MRFRLMRTSNNNGTDANDEPSPPYLEGAEVVRRAEYEWPGAVQYINVDTLEELMAIMATTGKSLVIRNHEPVWGEDIENVPIIEIYDSYRE